MRGFTLIEVLVTLLIFSIGLLAIAGLQTISKKANYDALQRTTASLLAHDILERMRANAGESDEYLSAGVALGGATYAAPSVDCAAADCNPVQMSWHDLYQWERALDGASERIDGALTGGLVSPTGCLSGPVGGGPGVYTVAIAWRGLTELSDPTIHACGSTSGKYGDNNEYRRILTITTYITPTS